MLFGADFDKQIQLPIGTWIAMKFATLIDPAIQSDVYCEKPWILSPLLCAMNTVSCRLATTMQYGQHTPDVFARNRHLSNAKTAAPELNFKNVISDASDRVILDPSPAEYLGDWIWKNEVGLTEDNSLLNTNPKEPAFGNDSIEERRKYFQKKKHRLAYDFSPDTIYNFEVARTLHRYLHHLWTSTLLTWS